MSVPPPLTGISNPPTSENTPPPNGPAMKIMRRGIPGKEKVKSLHTSNDSSQSEAPSKSGSEAGGEFQGLAGDILSQQENEAANAKEKGALTREEREAKYREARERIFKGFAEKAENEDINANTEAGNEISRSSSQTGKARIPGRKPRSANDDGFEARSQFAAFYPAPDYHVQPSPEVAQYGAYPSQPFGYDGQTLPGQFVSNQAFSPGLSPTRQSQTIAPYTMQPDQLPLAASNGNMHQSFPPVSQSGYGAPLQPQVSPSLHHASSPAGYPPMNANHLPGSSFGQSSRSHPDQSHPFAPQPVRQSPYHSPAPHFANPHNSAMEKLNVPSTLIGMGNPYPYGQLPGSHTVQSSRTRNSQHPIPGSFNRNIFNPQTQSFVPTGGPFRPSSSASFNSSPGSNHPGNIQPPFTAHNTSSHYAVPSGFSSPHFSRPDSTHHPQTSHGFVNAHTTSPYQQPSNPNHQSHQSTLPKWNNPPNLPPKPPAPAITTQPPQAYAAALKASLPGYMPNGSYHAGSFPAQTHHAGQTARNDVREG
ncbi:MAG: hypothetical protein M1837_004711 [Sclerophora amabilis]|nr:MAG: hypothetical protein M1837_004711 [Sclerophora amabilis]